MSTEKQIWIIYTNAQFFFFAKNFQNWLLKKNLFVLQCVKKIILFPHYVFIYLFTFFLLCLYLLYRLFLFASWLSYQPDIKVHLNSPGFCFMPLDICRIIHSDCLTKKVMSSNKKLLIFSI